MPIEAIWQLNNILIAKHNQLMNWRQQKNRNWKIFIPPKNQANRSILQVLVQAISFVIQLHVKFLSRNLRGKIIYPANLQSRQNHKLKKVKLRKMQKCYKNRLHKSALALSRSKIILRPSAFLQCFKIN